MKQIFFTIILALVFSFSVFAQTEKSPCPKIGVNGGGAVRSGESMSFTAYVGDDTNISKFEYEWTVSDGTIMAGLGSQTITVDTTELRDVNLTATVKIKGLPENCANTVSETGAVFIIKDIFPSDEFGKLPAREVKARIQNLYKQLSIESNSQGYIINYGTDREIAARENQILKAVSSLKHDTSRVTIARGGANPNGTGVWTKIWIVPPGADNPQP